MVWAIAALSTALAGWNEAAGASGTCLDIRCAEDSGSGRSNVDSERSEASGAVDGDGVEAGWETSWNSCNSRLRGHGVWLASDNGGLARHTGNDANGVRLGKVLCGWVAIVVGADDCH